ncbi:unnamed protein product [Mytilus coruscus]|uniref:Uncharacterized protein n=1 Tax=Mytilus coruscus TaxID=42192 RepID=A0A6J8D5Y8_MYTCO|nr:unnamed protein product [Mytilus coruscus]
MQHKFTIHELNMKHHLEVSELKAKVDRMTQQGTSTVSSVPQQQSNTSETPDYHQPLTTAPPAYHQPFNNSTTCFTSANNNSTTCLSSAFYNGTTNTIPSNYNTICSYSTSSDNEPNKDNVPTENSTDVTNLDCGRQNLDKEPILRTLNVQNALSNQLYLVNVLKKCDILFVQEHWLYSCDKHKLQGVNDTHICEAKSVDDDLDTKIFVRNRGFGGTAVFWRKDIDRVVRFTSDGNDRIVVLTSNISNNPLCLIGVYMPSHNKHGDELYIDIHSQIEKIIEKYHHIGYQVMLCGDMNASLFRDDRPRDKRFKCFIENNGLCLTDNYPKAPTFYHHNGVMSSQIAQRMPNWARCDKEKYQEAIRESVTNTDTVNLDNASSEISILVDLLHSAGRKSIPNYRETITVKTVGRGIWNKEISNASKLSKLAFFEWKNDKLDDSKYKGMNKARKVLRSAQRRAHASKRNTLTEKIMQESQNDSKLFHKLVKGQRKCNNILTDTMVFNGIEESDLELMMSGWKDYFENLYKLDNLNSHQNFRTEKLRVIEVQNKIIEELETERNIEIDNTNVLEVQEVVKALKTGKSPGPDGLSAEHFKLMPEELLTYIVHIVNLIFKDKDLPQETKEGVVSPVHKSGKDKLHPENYRGITVTNTFSTLKEGILKDRIEPKLLKIQNFYKEILEELILLTLDAQKAFDKLHHEILFNKMYHDEIVGKMWLLLRNMYRNVTVKVKWNNNISDKFKQEICVRQGAKLSTVLYKRYNNILEALERSNIGARIGNINVVAPTCCG